MATGQQEPSATDRRCQRQRWNGSWALSGQPAPGLALARCGGAGKIGEGSARRRIGPAARQAGSARPGQLVACAWALGRQVISLFSTTSSSASMISTKAARMMMLSEHAHSVEVAFCLRDQVAQARRGAEVFADDRTDHGKPTEVRSEDRIQLAAAGSRHGAAGHCGSPPGCGHWPAPPDSPRARPAWH